MMDPSSSDDGGVELPRRSPAAVEPSSMDIEQSLPTVAELTGKSDHEPTEEIPRRRRQGTSPGCLLCILFVVLGLVAIIVGAVVFDVRRDETAALKNGSNGERSQRFNEVVDYLQRNKISGEKDLLFDGSTQNMAAKWMAHDDPALRTVPTVSVEAREGYSFMQRYLMALLYFQMGGSTWEYDVNFLSEGDTCDWHRIYLSNSGRVPIGVQCNDDGFIVGLYFIGFEMSGPLPKDLGRLETLQVLELDLNNIQGSIPQEFEGLTNLEMVHLSHNKLKGRLPSSFGSFQKLVSLDVSFNQMSSALPTELARMTSLKGVALDHNLFSGSLVQIGVGSEDLAFLFLEHNLFTGTVDENWFRGLPNIKMLDMSDNKLEGELPSNIFDDCPQLQVLDMHDNSFIGSIPHALPNITDLRFLALHKNELDGQVPGSISNLRSLYHLDLSGNQLTGYEGQNEAPMRFGLPAMTNLTYLFLAANSFEPSPMPTWLAEMTKLEELSLKSLQIGGSIPTFIGALTNLILLDLDDNFFTGLIPTQMGNLADLQFLLLNRNRLNGQVPTEVTDLTRLRILYLDGNDLQGDLNAICGRPDSLPSPIMVADCGGIEPEVLCDCCEKCCTTNQLCNDDTLVPSNDPLWQFGYERLAYSFGNLTDLFIASP